MAKMVPSSSRPGNRQIARLLGAPASRRASNCLTRSSTERLAPTWAWSGIRRPPAGRGAEQPRDLTVPGRELDGIHFAMEFCRNKRPSRPAAKRVVIIGGGDTGADCLGTCHRQGALSVTQFELLPKPPDERSPSTPWPMWPMQLRVESSHEEGGLRDWSVSHRQVHRRQHGRVRQLHAVRVDAKPGTGFTMDADLVSAGDGLPRPREGGAHRAARRSSSTRAATWPPTSATCPRSPAIFAAGDMRRGQSLVVWAMPKAAKPRAESTSTSWAKPT